MDIIEIVFENIEANDSNAISKLVRHYIKTGKNKHTFIGTLINLFSTKYISKNLWTLREITKFIALIEESKSSKTECSQSLINICLLLAASNSKSLNLLKSKEEDVDRAKRLIYSFTSSSSILEDFKEYVSSDVFNLLHILYDNLNNVSQVSSSFFIIKYICKLKKKNIGKYDGYDTLFLLLIRFMECTELPQEIKEYVTMCKDIFYYRCKQKDKLERVNLLFYSVFVLSYRQVKEQIIDYRCSKPNLNKTDYLFVWMEYDDKKQEVSPRKNEDIEEKTIWIENYPALRSNIVDIKKDLL